MKAIYSIAREFSGAAEEWTIFWCVGSAHDLRLDRYATEAEAQVEADRLIALAWAPEA